MTDGLEGKVLETFATRSANYDNESSWVGDLNLITPLLGDPIAGGRMLDLCSGTCKVALHAKTLGWKAFACDLSFKMLRQCPDSLLPRVVCDATCLPFRNSSFELVTMRQGLQYLNLALALRELKRIASKRVALGHITLESEEDEPIWREYFSIASPRRIHIFRPDQIASLLERSGVKVVSQEITHTRDSFSGPIAHLGTTQILRLNEWIRSVPGWFVDRYQITPHGKMDYQYSHRWEFVTAAL
jgi:SAM-dependent methyltransferase